MCRAQHWCEPGNAFELNESVIEGAYRQENLIRRSGRGILKLAGFCSAPRFLLNDDWLDELWKQSSMLWLRDWIWIIYISTSSYCTYR
jgi:hypothetical protein